MNSTARTTIDAPVADRAPPTGNGRRVIDAPVRAFHWLFALSFAGAWLTADSERLRGVHVALGYAFGGLLLFRVLYGLLGPRRARLALAWRRATGLVDWLRNARAGRFEALRLATLGASATLLILLVAAPLVLSGYAGYAQWLGMDDALEAIHEFFAHAALSLVLAHLTLIALQSLAGRRNLARPMWTGRVDSTGPDLARRNHVWLAVLLVAAYLGFVGWVTASAPGSDAVGAQTPSASQTRTDDD